MGDPDRLKGVLLNLYSNAAKFTRAGFLAVRTRKITLAELQAGGFIDVRASYSACLAAMRSAQEVRGRARCCLCMRGLCLDGRMWVRVATGV